MDKLQWGNRKRLRCVKVKTSGKSDDGFAPVKKKITSRADPRVVTTTTTAAAACNEEAHHFPFPQLPLQSPNRLISRDLGMNNNNNNNNRWRSSSLANEGGKMLLSSSSFSPEKEEYKYYMTRGSVGLDESSRSKILMEAHLPPPQEDNNNNRYNNNNSSSSSKVVWPRLFIALSSKEKEEDFMAMKGCKPPQRPKKRAKLIQKSLLFVSPGAWLSDLCQERYEVREKKTSKKRPRGLKAMGSIESDSE